MAPMREKESQSRNSYVFSKKQAETLKSFFSIKQGVCTESILI
jgi:hypothetical protein